MITAATKSPEDTRELAGAVAGLVRGGDILLLAGELGAGKTCFTQGLGRALGVTEQVTSPTFTLLRPYDGERLQLLHADVYRLEHLQEIVDLGITEQVDGDAVAVIEWGDMAEPVLPADFLEIRLSFGDGDEDDARTLELRPVGAAWAARTGALHQAVERWALPGGGS
ncbi:MAG TPA: tRNA (adenosine(37)-N6)-threonylcarbamoyltransferase complex ATPase subunit type 1 TsaE [Acidimicrobiales bacterium]|nr:tRNA (adenosine(37)-N6)-threonylcarbamoyltransferase complex ATPase subunit type 1 TsaE [Acidimicrobiales bacterium]